MSESGYSVLYFVAVGFAAAFIATAAALVVILVRRRQSKRSGAQRPQ